MKQKEKKPSLFANKKFRMGTTATVLTVVFVVAALLVSIIADILNDRYPLNLDLTGDGLYTMSKESETVAKSVKEETEIVIFGDEDTYKKSTEVIAKQIYEFTRDYAELSGGKVKVSYVDSTKDPKAYATYSKYAEVNDGDVMFLSNLDETDENVRCSVVGAQDMFTYDEETYYNYGELSLTASLVEKVLATNVQMVTGEITSSVALLTGHKENETAIKGVQAVFRQNGYGDCLSIDITSATELNKQCNIAVICAPTEDYTDAELLRIIKWLENDGKRGKHLVVFTAPGVSCPKLYEFLAEEHGIKVEDYVVAESDVANMYALYGQYSQYAAYANVGETDYTKKMPAGSRVQTFQSRGLTPLWTTDTEESNSAIASVLASFDYESAIGVKVTAEDSDTAETVTLTDTASAVLLTTSRTVDSDTMDVYENHVMVIGTDLFLSLGSEQNETLFIGALNTINDAGDTVTVDAVSLVPESINVGAGWAIVWGIVFALGLPLSMLALAIGVFVRRKRL